MSRIAVIFSLLLGLSPIGIAGSDGPGRSDTAASTLTREEAALELVPFPWQELEYEIVFMEPRPGYRAMTRSRLRRIEIYARPHDDLELIAYDIAHEIGHVIDLTQNSSTLRKKWMKLRGIDPDTPWFGCNRCSDYNTPAGDFAETFAYILLGPGRFRSLIAPPPTPAQIRALTSFFPGGSFSAQID